MIEIRHLTKYYGEKCIFRDLNFTLPEHTITAFTGESGIGKTTLLKCITGLETPDNGEITGIKMMKKTFVFQENRLIESVSCLKNILAVAPDKDRAVYYLEKVGLSADKNTKAGNLSGGMKRRLAIARALAKDGDFYYLDEPLRELDEKNAGQILALLKNELQGKTGVLITHDKNEAARLADITLCFTGKPMVCDD